MLLNASKLFLVTALTMFIVVSLLKGIDHLTAKRREENRHSQQLEQPSQAGKQRAEQQVDASSNTSSSLATSTGWPAGVSETVSGRRETVLAETVLNSPETVSRSAEIVSSSPETVSHSHSPETVLNSETIPETVPNWSSRAGSETGSGEEELRAWEEWPRAEDGDLEALESGRRESSQRLELEGAGSGLEEAGGQARRQRRKRPTSSARQSAGGQSQSLRGRQAMENVKRAAREQQESHRQIDILLERNNFILNNRCSMSRVYVQLDRRTRRPVIGSKQQKTATTSLFKSRPAARGKVPLYQRQHSQHLQQLESLKQSHNLQQSQHLQQLQNSHQDQMQQQQHQMQQEQKQPKAQISNDSARIKLLSSIVTLESVLPVGPMQQGRRHNQVRLRANLTQLYICFDAAGTLEARVSSFISSISFHSFLRVSFKKWFPK